MPPRIEGQLSKALLEALPDPCLGIDRNGRLKLINPPAQALFDLAPSEALGMALWDLLPASDFSRAFIAMVKDSQPEPTEQVMVFPGDKLFVVQLVPVRGRQGRNLGAVALLRDMTGVKRIESELDQVLSDLSRQLVVPLTAIKGFVETLLEGAYGDPEIVRRFLQVINDETNRLTRLVMTLTEATRGGDLQLSRTTTRLEPLLRSAVAMFSGVAEQKGVAVRVQVPPDLPGLFLDPERFRRALINLVDNAVKFTALKGEGEVRVSARLREGEVEIAVEDTGVGIPPGEIPHIFEEFYRVAEGPAAELGGTGLGLAVARKIVEAHGGRLEAESTPGKGSRFTIIVPGSAAAAPDRGGG